MGTRMKVRALGVMPFDVPSDWNFRDSIVSAIDRTMTDGTKYVEVKYRHPSGDICNAVFDAPENRTHCPYDEMEVVVRFGTNSQEHKEYLKKAIEKGPSE